MLRNIWELRALHCIGRLRNWDYKLRSNMKQYSLVVILHICLLAILSVGVYVLYCADLWFSMLITFLFLLGTGIHLYYIQMKQLQMMRRLTDSLRYNDMTQAFRPPYKIN